MIVVFTAFRQILGMQHVAILLAAGRGTRMEGKVEDKVLASLVGRPVFSYSLRAFLHSGVIDSYVVVYRDEFQRKKLAAVASDILAQPTRILWVQGGAERRDSVQAALEILPDTTGVVYIHDVARPLLRPEWVRLLARAMMQNAAVTLAHPVVDTIKEAATGEKIPYGQTLTTSWRDLERARLWAMETPQVFLYCLIRRAYQEALAAGIPITDDTAAVSRLGVQVSVLHTPGPNFKLTTPMDFALADALLRHLEATA